jgi:hypothetical protein
VTRPRVEIPGPGDVAVPLRLRHGDRELSFLSIMASFGTPLDVTVAELGGFKAMNEREQPPSAD